MSNNSVRASILAVLLVASVLAVGIGVGSVAADQTTVEITVVDQTGNPVGGATLNLTWDGGSTTTTTVSNGKALVDIPNDKTVTVTVDASGYVRNEPFVISPGSSGSVTIPVHEDALATITVRNAAGPIQNAHVKLVKNGVAVIDGKTDADGKIGTRKNDSPEFIEVGTYHLEVVKPGYLKNTTTLEVVGHVKPTVTLEQSSVTATINVADPYYDPPHPVENATIKVGSIGTIRTLSSGEATIQVPVNSRPTITISKDGYESMQVPLLVEESPTSANLTLSKSPSLTLKPSADRVIVGENVSITVTDEYDDLVPGATVSINGADVGTTDDQGKIEVPVDSVGKQTISASTASASSSITIKSFDPSTPTPTAAPTTTAPTTTAPTTTAPTTAAPTTTGNDGTGSAFGPGFGPLAALLALLALAFVAGRR
ncbi:MAG: Ig-like domain-containing protein [Halapricum sp.]